MSDADEVTWEEGSIGTGEMKVRISKHIRSLSDDQKNRWEVKQVKRLHMSREGDYTQEIVVEGREAAVEAAKQFHRLLVALHNAEGKVANAKAEITRWAKERTVEPEEEYDPSEDDE